VTGRNMAIVVKEISARFPGGKEHAFLTRALGRRDLASIIETRHLVPWDRPKGIA